MSEARLFVVILSSMLHWVRLAKYCDLSGDTVAAVEARIRAGDWRLNIHARTPNGSDDLWVNLRAVNDWAAGEMPTLSNGVSDQAEPTLSPAAQPRSRARHSEASIMAAEGAAAHSNYVLIPLAAQLTGYTARAINAKIDSSVWAFGSVWKYAPDGRRVVIMDGYKKWAESHQQSRPVKRRPPPG